MAFGDLKGVLSTKVASVTNPIEAAGSIAVSVNDLIYVVQNTQTGLSITGVTDNLGNSYSAQNAGTDSGTATGRAYWARVTTAGTLTWVRSANTTSSNDAILAAAVIEGPFATSPLDANPANTTNTGTTMSCPATGTLAQADEYIAHYICSSSAAGSGLHNAVSPSTTLFQDAQGDVIRQSIGGRVVSSTATVTPQFTTTTSPGNASQGTISFKKGAAAGITGTLESTEAADTAAFAGKVDIGGTLAATEAADVASFAGQVIVSGTLTASEAADSAAFSGGIPLPIFQSGVFQAGGVFQVAPAAPVVTGTLAVSEAPDTASFAGTVANQVFSGPLAAIEAADGASFTGGIVATGTLAAVEAADAASFSGTVENLFYQHPDGDTATDGWTDQAGGTSNIYQSIDEANVDESDFVRSPATAGENILKVRLFDGGTQIVEWTHNSVPETPTDAVQTLTTPQYEAITNFNNLFAEFDDTHGNIYRFPLSNLLVGAAQPVTIKYRYGKIAA